ncbi:MAG: RecQ family ATP-dependent DNA helicase, partial [Pseudomonadota bacterium]
MEYSNFLAHCLSLDLETDEKGEIYAVGAIHGDRVFKQDARGKIEKALPALDRFAQGAQYLLGHNLLGHDLPVLQGLAPHLELLSKPVVDTLHLSPLAFPQNPYHRLVKDYKLVRDSVNDPVADARLAASVFHDQWESLAALAETESGLLSFYHYAFEGSNELRGLQLALEAMSAVPVKPGEAFDIFLRYAAQRVCATVVKKTLLNYLSDSMRRPALAYVLAWLRVAGGNSVLPPWVRQRFPDVAPILRQLRDIPCGRPDCVYCAEVHDPDKQLRRFFGFSAFRDEPATADGGSLQRAIVRYALGDRPLFAVLPTGGGKSLCYQLPALARYQRRGVMTVIISPLQALMKDQVDNLRNKTGAPNAAALNGLLTAPERGEVLKGVQMGDVAILYVSPEQLRNRGFRNAIRHREVGCWVFDEAHCLSKWGHDFRPDYLYAARFIREFSHKHQTLLPPVQCFTATAKQNVRDEIVDHFRSHLGQELAIFEGGVERDNLRFEVQTVASTEKYPRLHALLSERLPPDSQGCCIVYCATRRNTEAAAEYLQKQGWLAEAFHAGLNAAQKKHVQDNFIAGHTPVICATNAFGMGIDKEDVRLVVHADIPGSLDNYLQEAGRAGRDRLAAECVLLYDEQDIETQFKLSGLSRLNQRDIARLLKVLRKCKRDREGNVVITAGEMLRDEAMEDTIDPADRNAATKVATAVSWLERAGFLE